METTKKLPDQYYPCPCGEGHVITAYSPESDEFDARIECSTCDKAWDVFVEPPTYQWRLKHKIESGRYWRGEELKGQNDE